MNLPPLSFWGRSFPFYSRGWGLNHHPLDQKEEEDTRAASRENLRFAYRKIKAQISCAVTKQLISVFVYALWILPKSKIFKPLAIFCSCTARFVLDLVGNPEGRFSRDTAQQFHKLIALFVDLKTRMRSHWTVCLFDGLALCVF